MRDIVLSLIMAGLLPLALRHTWVGVLLWTWLSIMNPHRLAYGFAAHMPWAAAAAVCTLLSVLWNKDKLHFPINVGTVALMAFMGWICVTTLFAFTPEQSMKGLDRALKVLLMTLVAIWSIRERKHIVLFVWVNAISIGFYGVKGGLFAIATAGSARVWGPAGSFIEDNNALGLAIVMTMPLLYFLALTATRKWLKYGLVGALLLCALAALSTQSRGAFLALSAMGLVLWLRAPKKIVSGVLIAIFAVGLLAFMPKSWEDRMNTIGTYQQDTSAMSRINAWETAVNVANDRITGAGFHIATREVFQRYSPKPEWVYTAHSIYFQALGEHGYIGLFLFLSMGAYGFWTAGRVRKEARSRPETQWIVQLAGMIQVSMIGYAVGGTFLSLTYFDLPYNVLVMLIACQYWMKEERWKTERVGVFDAPVLSAAAAHAVAAYPGARPRA